MQVKRLSNIDNTKKVSEGLEKYPQRSPMPVNKELNHKKLHILTKRNSKPPKIILKH